MTAKKGTRTNHCMIRLSDEELRRIKRVCQREPVAVFCRRIVLEHVERREKSQRKGG